MLFVLKIVKGHRKLDFYRNTYVNLALPFFQSSEPMPVMKYKVTYFK